jgi:CHAT domain-containing protein
MAAASSGPILYYMSHQEGHAAWLVRRDGKIVFAPLKDLTICLNAVVSQLPFLRGRDLARDVEGEHDAALSDDHTLDALTALHEALLPPPIRQELAGQEERLVIVADPSLNAVPFSALRGANGRFLIEDFEVELWPSVTARLVLSARPSQRTRPPAAIRALVIGIGEFGGAGATKTSGSNPSGLPPLPGAIEEANSIAHMLGVPAVLDEQATGEILVTRGQGADIIHLATHGFLDEEHPEDSFVELSNGPLSARQLYRFDPGVRCSLVVMSACRTGLGGHNPDSVIGLSNAFLIAGAQCVVSTLWKIPDRPTVEIMQSFYRHILNGTSIAFALREAQREALKRPSHAAPYFWAAFRAAGNTGGLYRHDS